MGKAAAYRSTGFVFRDIAGTGGSICGEVRMKFVRRVSLFLVMSVFMLGAGGYTALKAEQFFYPNRHQEKAVDRERDERVYDNMWASGENAKKEQVIEAAVEKIPVVTADTMYLIEEVNLVDGTIREKQEAVPVKYIGLDRESLISELESYDRNPPLTELEMGFETIELTAFSKDRVVICKYYKDETEKGYYLLVEDHFIVVYEEDRQRLHMNTDILLTSLNDTLKAEIIQGKYIENEEELYNFLESYSS